MALITEWRRLRMRLQALLPLALLGVLALVTYWLVQNSPILAEPEADARGKAKPDAYFHRFKLVSFDEKGQWLVQMTGQQAWHRDDVEVYEIEQPRMIKQDEVTRVKTVVSAQRARTNEDGTQVQLFGDALIRRDAQVDAKGVKQDMFEIRSDYLLLDDQRQAMESHLPVTVKRGSDEMSAERMTALQLDGKLQLEGRVRGTLAPRRNP